MPVDIPAPLPPTSWVPARLERPHLALRAGLPNSSLEFYILDDQLV
jgi:hypothetical protein